MSLEEAAAAKNARLQNLKLQHAEIFSENPPAKISFEIGCGKGHWLCAYAGAFPEELCIGIDLISERIRDSIRRAKLHNVSANTRFVKAEANEFLESMPEGVKLGKVFIFFPDPWPKKKHHRRRLMQEDFLNYLRSFCDAGTKLYFRTDHVEYFQWTQEVFAQNKNWQVLQDNTLPVEEVSQFQRILPEFSTLVAQAI